MYNSFIFKSFLKKKNKKSNTHTKIKMKQFYNLKKYCNQFRLYSQLSVSNKNLLKRKYMFNDIV